MTGGLHTNSRAASWRTIAGALWVAGFALLLFLSAGTWRWPGAWVFLALLAAGHLWGTTSLARHDPGLLEERMRPPFQRGQKGWDKALMSVFIPLWFGWFVLMGLDRRFSWSGVPLWAQSLGLVLLCLGMALSMQVLYVNSFAATAVKVQTERGHKVISTGPYGYVRHPMYASVILVCLGVPLLLGSWWGLFLSPVLLLLLAVRAVMEERMLAAELEGYAGYAADVRYRLVPFVW